MQSQANFGNILEQNSLKSASETSQKNLEIPTPAANETIKQSEMESHAGRPSDSRASTNQAATEKIWTAEELLADEELWRVTDSSEDSEDEES